MSRDITIAPHLPIIKICENPDEIQAIAGQRFCHGVYLPASNTIVATADSIAHEIAHFRDIQSGSFINTLAMNQTDDLRGAKMRNEIVAILFSFQKCGPGGAHLPREKKFIDWIKFNWKQIFEHYSTVSKPSKTLLNELSFNELQSLSSWIVRDNQPWREQLEFYFRSYLAEPSTTFIYSRNSAATILSSKIKS